MTIGSTGFAPAPTRLEGEAVDRVRLVARASKYHHPFLDDTLRVILPNDLILVGAETGAGKTELATAIAKNNARAGKRVYLFALEAEPREIERRMKFAMVAELAARAGDPGLRDLNYTDWYRGACNGVAQRYDLDAERAISSEFASLHTFYRGARFDHEDIRRTFAAIADRADLIVLDHIHYVDIEDDNENRGFKDTVKMIRDLALRIGVPVVLVAHLRKRDLRFKQVVPHVEDFFGSSDLIKICTHAVMLCRAASVVPPAWYSAPTFIHVPKDRRGGATGFVALSHFDRRLRAYSAEYTLGLLSNGGTEWHPIGLADVPRWAKAHRPMNGGRTS